MSGSRYARLMPRLARAPLVLHLALLKMCRMLCFLWGVMRGARLGSHSPLPVWGFVEQQLLLRLRAPTLICRVFLMLCLARSPLVLLLALLRMCRVSCPVWRVAHGVRPDRHTLLHVFPLLWLPAVIRRLAVARCPRARLVPPLSCHPLPLSVVLWVVRRAPLLRARVARLAPLAGRLPLPLLGRRFAPPFEPLLFPVCPLLSPSALLPRHAAFCVRQLRRFAPHPLLRLPPPRRRSVRMFRRPEGL